MENVSEDQSWKYFPFEFVGRTTNAVIAPLRVVKDKLYAAITRHNDIQNEIIVERIYPKDKLCAYMTFFGNPTLVHDRVYLGSAYNAASYQTLVDHDIRLIINVTQEISNYYEHYIQYHQIPIRDNNSDSIKPYLSETYDVIEQFLKINATGNILIHCYMGASRSATISANYICKKTGSSPQYVVQTLKRKRANINLTKKFYDELVDANPINGIMAL